MKKRVSGILLLLLAAGAAAFWFWRRRDQASAADPSAEGQPIQVTGATTNEDITGDIVRLTLDYAKAVNAGCWTWIGTAQNGSGNRLYRNSVSGAESWFNLGQFPINTCGLEP